MDVDWKAWAVGGAWMLGMLSIIPLMVWGGSGDWRQALRALREYLQIALGAVVLVGGLALLVTLAEVIDRQK